MSQTALPEDALVDKLRLLCAQPSVSGQARGLAQAADGVAAVLRDAGLDCRIVATPGAPIVIGQYTAGAARTLLVYGRYDVPAPGSSRDWSHDPFQPTIDRGMVYARGAVIKAELVARAAALGALIAQRVPLNVVFVVEGDSQIGSPHLALARDATTAVDLCLWSGGGFDAQDRPLFFSGVKGLLQVALESRTASGIVPAAYAATVPNPIWQLTLALASIKSEFEEILIEGFYDEITPPSRADLDAVQGLELPEQARRDAWGVQRFVAGVSGRMLARTELFSPSCNISALGVMGGGMQAIPHRARAELQFQLVPSLTPERLFELLHAHLSARGFADFKVQRLPGGFAPARSRPLPFNPAQAAATVYDQPAAVVPLAPFSAPVALLAPEAAFVSCGLERPASRLFGADEHVPLSDLGLHTRLITELITHMAV